VTVLRALNKISLLKMMAIHLDAAFLLQKPMLEGSFGNKVALAQVSFQIFWFSRGIHDFLLSVYAPDVYYLR
jgi:hypothetical protein